MTIVALHPSRLARRAAGFTLVEVTLALGIAVFALVVMFGLLNVGVASSTASFEQTVATGILSSVAADLRSAPRITVAPAAGDSTSNPKSLVYKLELPPAVAAGATPTFSAVPAIVYLDASGQIPDTNTPAPRRYRLSVWTRPGVDRQPTLARVLVSWPATADPAATTGAKVAGSVEALIALDRN